MIKLIEKLFGMTPEQTEMLQKVKELVDLGQYKFTRLEKFYNDGQVFISYQFEISNKDQKIMMDSILGESLMIVANDAITAVFPINERNSAHLKEFVRNLAYSKLKEIEKSQELKNRNEVKKALSGFLG